MKLISFLANFSGKKEKRFKKEDLFGHNGCKYELLTERVVHRIVGSAVSYVT